MGDIVPKIEDLLNKLNREELLYLNRAILRRVKIMDDLKRLKEHSAFYPGDKVSWNDKYGVERIGRVLRVNTKSISVEEEGDSEGTWRVSASLLRKVDY